MKNMYDILIKKPLLLIIFKESEVLKMEETKLALIVNKYCEELEKIYNLFMKEININDNTIESFALEIYEKLKETYTSIIEKEELESLTNVYPYSEDIKSEILGQDELFVMDNCVEEKCKIKFFQYSIDINIFMNLLIVDVRKMIENSYEKYLQNEIKSLKNGDTKMQIANFILSGYFPINIFNEILDDYFIHEFRSNPIFGANGIQETLNGESIFAINTTYIEEMKIYAAAYRILGLFDSIYINSYATISNAFGIRLNENPYTKEIFACKMLMNIGTKLNLQPYNFIKDFIIPKNRLEIFRNKLIPYILPAFKQGEDILHDELENVINNHFSLYTGSLEELYSMIFEKYFNQ